MKRRIQLILLLGVIFTNSCSLIAPTIFSDFDEKHVVGPGTYEEGELNWSFDGKYLAYVDQSGEWPTLGIYDLNKKRNWTVSETHNIAWHPDGRISYLVYIPNTNGMTYPIHNDLYIVDLNEKNDMILVRGLGNINDFIWLENGKEILFIEREIDNLVNNIYKLDTVSGERELFINVSELDKQNAYSIDFSPDQKQLLIWMDNPCEKGRGDCVALVIYDMDTRQVSKRILGSELTSLTLENGGVYSLNTSWINNDWITTEGHAILNEAPYLSLVFVNTKDISQSFEIEAQNQFGGPILSPDLAYIAYINVNRGPHTQFITISKTPQDILDKLTEE